MLIRSFVILLCLAISACATYSPELRRKQADDLAAANDWQRLVIPTHTFDFVAYIPQQSASGQTLTIYIEGDGLAWLGRQRLSPDPTPANPLGLKLALHHPAGMAAYLARPCQYVAPAQSHNCAEKYWSSHRFAAEVIHASNEAISVLKNRLQAKELVLVGYSGGGAVASLVAARRNDVKMLITVAGNLDHRAWTELHQVSPLDGSLNPAEAWPALVDIPQIHFVGAGDKITGRAVSRAYQQRFPADKQPLVRVVDGFDHDCCWVRDWKQLFPAARQPETSTTNSAGSASTP